MADTILTLKQLEDIFRNLTCTLLGLDPTDPLNGSKVRQSWPTTGAPAWKITDDVVFLRVRSIDSPYSKQRDISYTPNNGTQVNTITSYTLPRLVSWQVYGPNSYEKSQAIYDGLFLSAEILAASNLYLVLDVPVPARGPDLSNGQWWERSVFSATFNEQVTKQAVIPSIGSSDINFVDSRPIIVH